MSANPVQHKYSRHIDIRRCFVRERVQHGVLKLIPLYDETDSEQGLRDADEDARGWAAFSSRSETEIC